jgi:hypothetical protein
VATVSDFEERVDRTRAVLAERYPGRRQPSRTTIALRIAAEDRRRADLRGEEIDVADQKVYRDSKTGEWVTQEYAEANPDTTQSHTVTDEDARAAVRRARLLDGEEQA